jgi:hypothetical protein
MTGVYTAGLDDSRFQPCCVCVCTMGEEDCVGNEERKGSIIEAKGGAHGGRASCVCVCVAGLMHTHFPTAFGVGRRTTMKMAAAARQREMRSRGMELFSLSLPPTIYYIIYPTR